MSNAAGLEGRRRQVWERVVSLQQRKLPLSQSSPFPKGTSEVQRKALNALLAEALPALADEVARDEQLQDEILDVLSEIVDGNLTSQAFFKCLERECKTKMQKFDAKAWRSGMISLLDEFCRKDSFVYPEIKYLADSDDTEAPANSSEQASHRELSNQSR
ncbi:hypothetical protein GUITHDRAFT_135191 [Guillardia theta CCMP2712]|uniref:Uncharacterized protein n=1 Tax=Guillardia theta (strain CCMP2712) TaxID=905079 RepID=L1JQI0_GUITC|nr:hypothetical protein GUITHDRAFT_135191 [Guillardia theta CCMP2712]EKX50549.1 hypothetical protein GUITHDRAFT_135191 [Guillardia theta CCMP2712]|mmetsp:Transcript_40820/g.128589  ORF Transcript_40820/g.128589 Transcript_40820/m.128589 type:complete len:160 (-) Transcript_40820:63-542(-)|eukprot:XP_005837529.1 hypothetical protein GUITHDRAFT_135191 [Guillardia theta CCMP2712]